MSGDVLAGCLLLQPLRRRRRRVWICGGAAAAGATVIHTTLCRQPASQRAGRRAQPGHWPPWTDTARVAGPTDRPTDARARARNRWKMDSSHADCFIGSERRLASRPPDSRHGNSSSRIPAADAGGTAVTALPAPPGTKRFQPKCPGIKYEPCSKLLYKRFWSSRTAHCFFSFLEPSLECLTFWCLFVFDNLYSPDQWEPVAVKNNKS